MSKGLVANRAICLYRGGGLHPMFAKRIKQQSVEDSNIYLRALWAELRKEFTRVAWHYAPRKFGKKRLIRFGWVQLGKSNGNTEVLIKYARLGVLEEILFYPETVVSTDIPDIEHRIDQCTRSALRSMAAPTPRRIATRVVTFCPVNYYIGKRWFVGPLNDGSTELSLQINSFDDKDAAHEFEVRLALLQDALAVWTNFSFSAATDDGSNSEPTASKAGEYWDEQEWLDGHPIKNGLICLEDWQILYGDEIVSGRIGVNDKLARAARLFHEALLLKNNSDPRFVDAATALAVSSLEVASLSSEPNPVCEKCNQPIYRIAKRVADHGVSHLGEGSKWVFDRHYQRRSKFLHTGELIANQPFVFGVMPQLNPSAPDGCSMPRSTATPHNLIEFASYILREEMRDLITNQSTLEDNRNALEAGNDSRGRNFGRDRP